MLPPLIIFLSVMFAAISIGVQIFISKNFLLTLGNDDNRALDSSKLKAGAIILLVLNAYSLIKSIISLATTYSKDYIVYDVAEEVGHAFYNIFSLVIILSYITFGILLLTKSKRLALLSATSIIILSIFNSVFINEITILNAYVSLFPSLLVLSSFIILFTPFEIAYQKIAKATPFLFLLIIINPVISIISLDSFDIFTNILAIVTTILKVVAFILIFTAVTPSTKNDESDDNTPKSIPSKKIILIVLSILIFPLVLSLISSIDKNWLFVSLILLAIALPIVIVTTRNSVAKTRVIALICTFSAVIGLCVITKFLPSLPKSNEEFDPNKCYWCDGYGLYVDPANENGLKICSHCHGSGKRG